MMTYDDIKKLPKADLHCHLDGSLTVPTLVELAQDAHVKLPDELSTYFGRKFGSLDECLEVFKLTTSVMQTYRALVHVAWDLAAEAYRENVTDLEVRFAPHLHTVKGLTSATVLDAVLMGLRGATTTYGIRSTVIVCGIRNLSPELSFEMAELAVAHKLFGVVGFDLAGPEEGFPPGLHEAAIKVAKAGGLGVTIHAGEASGVDGIYEALELGADRIGHGCRMIDDPSLVKRFVEKGIPLECCPSSNLQTGVVADMSDHPLKKLLRAGVKVTVNTDNRLVHDTNLTKELLICHEQIGLTDEEVNVVIANGLAAKFTNHAIKPR